MKYVYEVIDAVVKEKSRKEKIRILVDNDHWALKDILLGTLSEDLEFNLPAGEPPYNPSEGHNAPSNLKRRHKEFRNFVKGGPGDRLPAYKREGMFIGLLEAIHPQDALLVIAMINKKKPKGITKALVEEAFPDLFE